MGVYVVVWLLGWVLHVVAGGMVRAVAVAVAVAVDIRAPRDLWELRYVFFAWRRLIGECEGEILGIYTSSQPVLCMQLA